MKLSRFLKGPKVNRVIKFFVFADLIFFAGWGFVSPIFSIFIIEEIKDATVVAVGISAAVYWLSRSLVQPFIANAIDKRKGEKDDFYVLMLGLILAGVSAFLFTLVETLPQLYALQVVHGVSLGAYYVSWTSIFSRHLDKDRPAFDWSFDNSTIGIAVAVASFGGGLLAGTFGFDVTFMIAGWLSIISAGVIFLVPDLVLPIPHHVSAPAKVERRRPPTTH